MMRIVDVLMGFKYIIFEIEVDEDIGSGMGRVKMEI